MAEIVLLAAANRATNEAIRYIIGCIDYGYIPCDRQMNFNHLCRQIIMMPMRFLKQIVKFLTCQ